MPQAADVRPGFLAGALRRRWKVVVAGLLAGIALGVGGMQVLPVTYASEAALFINPLVGNPYAPSTGTSRNDQLVALQTEASLIASPEVAELAAARSATALPDNADRHVNGRNPSNSQILTIEFTATSPAVATAGAQAFAEAYLEYRTQRATAANAVAATQVDEQIERTRALLDATSKELAAAEPGSAAAVLYGQQVSVYAGQLAQLNVQRARLTAAPDPSGEVITPASVPVSPSGIPGVAVLVACGVLGLAAGGVLALALEHADNRIHDVDELTAAGAGHPLALVPAASSATDLAAPSPEGYRLLHAMVTARGDAVTDGEPGSGTVVAVIGPPTTRTAVLVAAGLATAAARAGRTVAIVAADAPAAWDTAQRFTTTAVRSERGSWPTGSPRKRSDAAVVVVGSDGPDSDPDFVTSSDFEDFLKVGRQARDLVVLAGGASRTAMAWRMAEVADLTVIAVELGHDTYDDVSDLVHLLSESQIDDIAVVGVTTRTSRADTRTRTAKSTAAASGSRPRATKPRRGVRGSNGAKVTGNGAGGPGAGAVAAGPDARSADAS